MKNDGRKFDRSTQVHVRRQVVLAVRKGMTQVEAAKVFGMSLRFVQKTCARARDGGLRSLKVDDRGRPAGAALLDSTQQVRIYRMITGKMPISCGCRSICGHGKLWSRWSSVSTASSCR